MNDLYKINEMFDKQTDKYKKENNHREYCLNKLSKEIFNLTIDFDIIDWKKTRGGNYWQENDLLFGIEKKIHTIKYIKEYVNNKHLNN